MLPVAQSMEPKIRVWVVFGKQLKLGAGRAQLLRLIDERGSLRKAAAEFGMSYRNAWGYLQELERAAGFRFVERTPGAGPRSGMRLTPAGREFLACYAKFRGGLEEAPRRHFTGAFKGKEFRTWPRSPERSARARAAGG
jgi:molybdate transport system regulatory protein